MVEPNRRHHGLIAADGFTLVEMLLATALTAVLLVAVLRATVSIARTHRAISEKAGDTARQIYGGEAWMVGGRARARASLHELVRDDLIHATQVRRTQRGVVIVGYTMLDPATRERTHMPCRVEYRVVRGEKPGDTPWLVRDQVLLVKDTSLNAVRVPQATSELVASGVGMFSVEDADIDSRKREQNDPDTDLLNDRMAIILQWLTPAPAPGPGSATGPGSAPQSVPGSIGSIERFEVVR